MSHGKALLPPSAEDPQAQDAASIPRVAADSFFLCLK